MCECEANTASVLLFRNAVLRLWAMSVKLKQLSQLKWLKCRSVGRACGICPEVLPTTSSKLLLLLQWNYPSNSHWSGLCSLPVQWIVALLHCLTAEVVWVACAYMSNWYLESSWKYTVWHTNYYSVIWMCWWWSLAGFCRSAKRSRAEVRIMGNIISDSLMKSSCDLDRSLHFYIPPSFCHLVSLCATWAVRDYFYRNKVHCEQWSPEPTANPDWITWETRANKVLSLSNKPKQTIC